MLQAISNRFFDSPSNSGADGEGGGRRASKAAAAAAAARQLQLDAMVDMGGKQVAPLDISHVPALTVGTLLPPAPAPAPASTQDVPVHPELHRQFEPLSKLGEGGYAVVLRVRSRSSGEYFVLKKINEAFNSDADAQRVVREVAYQRWARHPNLLPLREAYISPLSRDLYLRMPCLSLDLHEAVRSGRLRHELQRQCVAFQLVCALGHMHATNVLHRDLKPPNVLLDEACRVMLCDFGLARTVPKPPTAPSAPVALVAPPATAAAAQGGGGAVAAEASSGAAHSFFGAPAPAPAPTAAPPAAAAPARPPPLIPNLSAGYLSRSVGSRWYRAPELLVLAPAYGPAADMWSLGCVLAELMSGKTLLIGSSSANQLVKICQITGGRPSAEALAELQVDASEEGKALVAALPDPIEPSRLAKHMPRASVQGIDLCKALLKLRPSERLDAAAVLRHPYFEEFVRADEGRTAYATASLSTEGLQPFVPPLEDGLRMSAYAYRSFLEERLATGLIDPEVPAPAATPAPIYASQEEMDDAMGA